MRKEKKKWNKAHNLTSTSGTCLRVLHGVTTVAVATVDLTKLSSLNGELENRRLNAGERDH